MAHGIMRVEKCKGAGVGKAQWHNDRGPGNHGNKDIDSARTHLNYELVPHGDYSDEIEKRIVSGGVTRKVRHDAVKLMNGIITASPEFFKGLTQEKQREYFQDCFEFCQNRFGKENMVAFTVHLDETTPHAHFVATPIKDGRLAWNQVFKGADSFHKMQNDCHEQVFKKWGLERGVVDSGRSHKKTEELKKESERELVNLEQDIVKAENTLGEVNNGLKTAQNALEDASQRIDEVSGEVSRLEDQREVIKEECNTLQSEKECLQQDCSSIESEIARLNAQITRREANLHQDIPPNTRREGIEIERLDERIGDAQNTRDEVAGRVASLEAETRREEDRCMDGTIPVPNSVQAGKVAELDANIQRAESVIPNWRSAVEEIGNRIAAARKRLRELPSLIDDAWNSLPFAKQVAYQEKIDKEKPGLDEIAQEMKAQVRKPQSSIKRGYEGR